MKSPVCHLFIACVATSIALAGCALTQKAEMVDVRTFSVELPSRPAKTEPAEPSPARLMLGQISAASHLRKRIVFRSSAVELGVYDDRRWSEEPEEYVRRALDTAIFEERRVGRVVGGAAPILDVEVVSFEEVREGKTRGARVDLRFTLHDDTNVLRADRVVVDTPAKSAKPEDIATAMADALQRAATQIAEAVRDEIKVGVKGTAP